MPAKKTITPQAKPFLETAAEAIGTALGKLAVKTGVAASTSVTPKKKRAKGAVAAKKKAAAPRKTAAKKSAR